MLSTTDMIIHKFPMNSGLVSKSEIFIQLFLRIKMFISYFKIYVSNASCVPDTMRGPWLEQDLLQSRGDFETWE